MELVKDMRINDVRARLQECGRETSLSDGDDMREREVRNQSESGIRFIAGGNIALAQCGTTARPMVRSVLLVQ